MNLYQPYFNNLEKEYLEKAISSGWLTHKSTLIQDFADKLKKYIKCEFVLPVNNGSSACILALQGANIKKGDLVVTSSSSYAATAFSISNIGAIPVFVDVDPNTWLFDYDLVEHAIKKHDVKGIFAVDLLGNCCNRQILKELCEKHNLSLISDSCEALTSFYNDDEHAGVYADTASFSTYINKQITTIEGGFVTTNSEFIFKRIKKLHGQGVSYSDSYYHDCIAWNFRPIAFQAAFGLAQLEKIDEILNKKKFVFEKYKEELGDLVSYQQPEEGVGKLADWMFCIKLKSKTQCLKVKDSLLRHNIEHRPFFFPLHRLKPYNSSVVYDNGVAMDLRNTCIFLPSYPELKFEQIEYICDVIKRNF